MRRNRLIFTVIFLVCLLVSRTVVNNEHNVLYSEDQKTYGYFDSIIFDLNEAQVEKLSKGLTVKRCGLIYTNSQDCTLNSTGDTVITGYFDETAKDMVGYKLEEGAYPSKADEIAVTSNIAQEYGIKNGDNVELKYNGVVASYKVTGIINDYIGEWRSNPNRLHDMRLLQMPTFFVTDGSSFLKDSKINAVLSMVKVSESDSSVNVVDEFANYLFDNAAGYEKHVYYSELSEQGYAKYKVFAGLGTDLSLIAVVGFVLSIIYIFERNEDGSDNQMVNVVHVIAGVLIAGAICLVIGLIGGQLFRLSFTNYIICAAITIAVAVIMEFLISYDRKNGEILSRGKRDHIFYCLYVLLTMFTVKIVRDLIFYGKFEEISNIGSFMGAVIPVSCIVCICSWIVAGFILFGKGRLSSSSSKGRIGLMLLLTLLGAGLGLIILII